MTTHIILTEDGSHSLIHDELHESFHSIHGAVQESKHVFIEAGLKHHAKDVLNILEIGFGTGLNAFLTLLETSSTIKKIDYTAVELYPLSIETACLLNYPEFLASNKKDEFYLLHTAPWQCNVQITPQFNIHKIRADFSTMSLSGHFDVVFFDAFSPEKQPEMWTEKRFKAIYDCCDFGAVLTTYCAKGSVRRAIQATGFDVERLPGPPGKREMLRAKKRVV